MKARAFVIFLATLVVSLATLGATLSFSARGGVTQSYPAIHSTYQSQVHAAPPVQASIASRHAPRTSTASSNNAGLNSRAPAFHQTSGTRANLLSTDNQDIGFTGYVKDVETGLYYAKARYYDPRIGRFITQDPEEGNPMQPPSLHRYLYAYANPTVYTDPSGRCGQGDEDLCTMNAGLALGWSNQEIEKELKVQHNAEVMASGEAYGTSRALLRATFNGAKFAARLHGALYGAPGSETLPLDLRNAAAELADDVRSGPVGLIDYLTDVSVRSERQLKRGEYFEAGEVFGDRNAAAISIAAPALRYFKVPARAAAVGSPTDAIVVDAATQAAKNVAEGAWRPVESPTGHGVALEPVQAPGALPSPERGPVQFKPPPNATPQEIAQMQAYCDGCNLALARQELSPSGRVSTKGELRQEASRAAAKERARAESAGQPYEGQAGHVPDTTWTGNPNPPIWQDLSPRVNASLGGQAGGYPIGYQPTVFELLDGAREHP